MKFLKILVEVITGRRRLSKRITTRCPEKSIEEWPSAVAVLEMLKISVEKQFCGREPFCDARLVFLHPAGRRAEHKLMDPNGSTRK